MSQLQQQFEREMEIHWCNEQGEPDIDYVNWLEAMVEKLTASNSAMVPCPKCKWSKGSEDYCSRCRWSLRDYFEAQHQ